jgi:hypothetical protein
MSDILIISLSEYRRAVKACGRPEMRASVGTGLNGEMQADEMHLSTDSRVLLWDPPRELLSQPRDLGIPVTGVAFDVWGRYLAVVDSEGIPRQRSAVVTCLARAR